MQAPIQAPPAQTTPPTPPVVTQQPVSAPIPTPKQGPNGNKKLFIFATIAIIVIVATLTILYTLAIKTSSNQQPLPTTKAPVARPTKTTSVVPTTEVSQNDENIVGVDTGDPTIDLNGLDTDVSQL